MSVNNPYYYCNIEGETNVGCKRKQNEDWLESFECKNGLVAIVCDGMGGHVGGQVASHLAIDTIKEFVCGNTFNDPNEMIIAACDIANQAILNRTAAEPQLAGMGSTCVMLVVRGGKVYVGSVGDSRVYLVRSKKIIQLTKDQSYVQMLVDMGEITREQAERHPRRNEITNALGLPTMRPATVLDTPIIPEAGDCFLLCSDGLSGMVSDEAIAKIVSSQASMSQRERVSALIKAACDNGGNDNVTCQIVEFSVSPHGEKKKKGSLLWLWILLSVLFVTLAGGGAAAWYFLSGESDKDQKTKVDYKRSVKEPEIIKLNSNFKFKAGNPVFIIKKNNDDVYELEYKISAKKDTTIQLEGVEDLSCMVYTKDMFDVDSTEEVTTFKFGKNFKGNSFIIKFDAEDVNIAYFFNVSGAPEYVPDSDTSNSGAKIPEREETPAPAPVSADEGVAKVFRVITGDDNVSKATFELSNDETTVIKIEYTNASSAASGSDAISQKTAEFKETESDVDCGWYKYSATRIECTVTVNNSKVEEEKQLISIPLADGKKYEFYVVKPANN
ncbi:MAG: Stp1/IreP family PP2C-type Ser/Thr phosphatase [Bacteroidales bacterium]|nr:Stp1/IreP family PP2C-type Ser/Thr phosphatase [Bacteroidales bacterium]